MGKNDLVVKYDEDSRREFLIKNKHAKSIRREKRKKREEEELREKRREIKREKKEENDMIMDELDRRQRKLGIQETLIDLQDRQIEFQKVEVTPKAQ